MVYNIRLIILGTLFVLVSTLTTFADNPNIISFNRMQYHAGNKNWSISEDNKGVMYIGNDLGLLEFDGISWALHKLKKAEIVRAVYAASNTKIFTGGYEEFGFWQRDISGSLHYTSLSDSLAIGSLHNDDIWRIWEKDKHIYFQSFNAIYIYDNKTVKQLPTNKNFLFLIKVRGELWAQQIGGSLYQFQGTTYKEIPGSDIFSRTEVKSILPANNGKYLIATSSMGIYLYDGKSFTPWNTSLELTTSYINCGVVSSQRGTYYFGTILNGVYELSSEGKILNHFNTSTYLYNNTVLAIYEDTSGNIWLGLDRGISCIQYLKGITCVTDPSGRIGAVYTAVLFNGKLVIGTNQGVYYINQEDLSSMNALSKARFIPNTEGQVWTLKIIDGVLYCGHNSGLFTIDSSFRANYVYSVHTGVFNILKKDPNYLLLATYTGLKVIEEGKGVLQNNNWLNEPIMKVETDHLGNTWLEHMNKGVYRSKLDGSQSRAESLEYFGSEPGNDLPFKMRLFKIGGRVAFLGNDQFYTYNDIDGKIVPEQAMNQAFEGIEDLENVVNIGPDNFWVLGKNIIYNVKYNEQRAIITTMLDVGNQSFSMIDNYENIVALNDTLSLVCLDNGFLLCNNNLRQITDAVPLPYIKSVKVINAKGDVSYLGLNNTETQSVYQIGNSNSIEFQFSAPETFSRNVAFQYQLIGLSDRWITVYDVNKILFERLPRGDYSLMLRTIDRYGKVSESITYNFEVSPAWYLSAWAIFIYVLFLILSFILVTAYMKYRYKKIHLKKLRILESKRLSLVNEKLQQEVAEKNAELLSQTSSIIQRNEVILNIKNVVEEFFRNQNNKSLQPLYQKITTSLNNNLDAESDWKMFLIKFEQKHTNFFKGLKEIYPQLTPNDLKLCACLRLNMDSKEIASLMNISVRAVENSRSRLRKKLEIPPNQHLNEFFLQFS